MGFRIPMFGLVNCHGSIVTSISPMAVQNRSIDFQLKLQKLPKPTKAINFGRGLYIMNIDKFYIIFLSILRIEKIQKIG